MFPEDAARRRMAEVLEASPPASIEGALIDLAGVLDRPGEADPATVGVACTRIARWAEGEDYPYSSAEFHQAAANACLANPSYALAAGRAARKLADYGRSEVWLQRSIGLSRQARLWRTYSESFLEFGTMMRRRGNLPAAKRHFERSYRRSIRAGLLDLRAQAAHDLFVVATEYNEREVAGKWALEALRAYPRGDRNLPRLAFDMAFVWLEEELFDSALQVFLAVEVAIEDSGKPVVWGGIGRAAGGAGNEEQFDRAWNDLATASALPGTADAWLEMARGARYLGRLDSAHYAARQAQVRARARAERKIEILAEQFLSVLNSADVPVIHHRSPTDTPWGPVADEVVEALQPV